MDLKNFKVLSKDQYDALSEREQVKYEMQLEAFKEQEQKRIADESVKSAIDAMKEDLKKERETELKDLSDANEKALKDLAEKYEGDIESFKAQLSRAKVSEVKERMKTMSDEIIEKLSTEEGEALLKGFLRGAKDLNVDLEAKAMVKPVGGVAPQFTPIVGPGHDETHARDVIPVFPTISDVIKYIQYTVDTTAAGIGTVAEGATKPQLAWVSAVKDATVRKIAAIVDISEENLDDIVGLRAWLAYELPKVYMDFEDMQIFKGNGTGQNLLGLWQQGANQTLPLGTVTTNSSVIDKVAAGITEVRVLKRATSAVFVSPVAYMEIFINKSSGSGEYTYPVLMDSAGVLRIGGVPVYWSNCFESNQGLVGDFARGTAIFQRKAMNIAYSNEHKDNFATNVVSVRIEGRIALPIYYPEAFKKLLLTPPVEA